MTRNALIFIASLFCLLGGLTTALGTEAERNYQLRGYSNPIIDKDLPYRIPRLGVNVELTQYTRPEQLTRQFQLMQQANITWVRQFFPWDQIQPQPDRYDWERWDAIIAAAEQAAGLQLVAVLVNSPAWSRPSAPAALPSAPPDDPQHFADFANAFASRYGHIIDFYQIWDEPNLTIGWGGQEPRVAHYAALLGAAYTAIHEADAGATVLLAALAPTTETGPLNLNDITFLRDLYLHGASAFFDAAASKPYGFDYSPLDRIVHTDRLNFSRIIALREEMIRAGDGTKPLWASGWGWNSLPPGWQGQPSIWGAVSSEERQRYTLQALDRAEREWPWIGGMILDHWQPAVPADDPRWGFALLDLQGQPSSLWQSLAARKPIGAAANGLFSAANPFARYSGVWTFSPLGADIGWLQDSQVEFDFVGRDIALLLRQDNFVGYLYPTIDGQPANALPRDAAGNAYVVLTSGSLLPEKRLVPIARNLSDSVHTLHMIADRGWDRWALVGYAVSSGDLSAPYQIQINVAWLLSVLAALSAVISGRKLSWGRIQPLTAHVLRVLQTAGEIALSLAGSLALMIGMLLTWGDGTPAIFRRELPQMGLAFLTAGLIYLEPGFIFTLLAAFFLFTLIYNRLELGLMLTLFWAPFFLFPIELYDFAFPMSEVIILMTGIAWMLRKLAELGRWRQSRVSQFTSYSRQSPQARLNGLDYLVISWVILGGVSIIWAAYRAPAITELRVMIVEPAIFYLVLRSLPPARVTLLRLTWVLLMSAAAVSLIGLILFLRGEGIITAEGGIPRLASVYGSPNNLSLFLGRCLPFALAYTLIPLSAWQQRAALGIFLLSAWVLLLTQSAGAIFIGVPASLITVLLLTMKRQVRRYILIGLVIGLAAFLLALQSPRFARILDFTSGTNFFRIRAWQSSLQMIQDHPLAGLGLDQFLYAFRGHYILPDAWQEPNLSHPHNILLDFWLRLGLGGVGLLIAFQWVFWRRLATVIQTASENNHPPQVIAIAAGGSMVNLLAHGLVDNSVFVPDLAIIFMFLIGLAAALPNIRAIDEVSP